MTLGRILLITLALLLSDCRLNLFRGLDSIIGPYRVELRDLDLIESLYGESTASWVKEHTFWSNGLPSNVGGSFFPKEGTDGRGSLILLSPKIPLEYVGMVVLHETTHYRQYMKQVEMSEGEAHLAEFVWMVERNYAPIYHRGMLVTADRKNEWFSHLSQKLY